MKLLLSRLGAGRLRRFDGQLASGLHVVLGASDAGGEELIELLTGVRVPEKGSVRWSSGAAAFGGPAERASIMGLLARESVPVGGSLAQWLEQLSTQLAPAHARALLEAPLTAQRSSRVSELSPEQWRAVALSLALTHPEPRLLALFEPWRVGHDLQLEWIERRLHEQAARSIVVVATASPTRAQAAGGVVWVMENGVLARTLSANSPRHWGPGLSSRLRVRCSDPSRLADALGSHADVTSLSWEREGELGVLRVEGRNPERLALALAEQAVRAEVEVFSMAFEGRTLEEVHATSAGLASAAYQAARRTGFQEASSEGP